MRLIAAILLVLALLLGGSSYFLTSPVVEGQLYESVFAGMALAPPDRAVTLARSKSGQVLLVRSIDARE